MNGENYYYMGCAPPFTPHHQQKQILRDVLHLPHRGDYSAAAWELRDSQASFTLLCRCKRVLSGISYINIERTLFSMTTILSVD